MCLECSLLQVTCAMCEKGRAKSCMLCVWNVAISKGCVLCVEGEELYVICLECSYLQRMRDMW